MYRVAVVRGGPSDEHDVSLNTGRSVLQALESSEFTPVDVVITRNNEWLSGGKTWDPISLLQTVDVVFIALHGFYGEDGRIQRYLDTHRVPYTGSGAFPSSVAMNKALTKTYLQNIDVKLAPHVYATRDIVDNPYNFAEASGSAFEGPYVIKPVSGGSSVGTHIARNTLELGQVLDKALQAHDQLLIEKRLIGREATVGVIDNFRDTDVYLLPPIEIVPKTDFFDYEAKYGGATEEICPGRFSQDEKELLMNAAKAIHKTLDLSQYSRSDFILTDDGVYFLEVNTLPGLTTESLMPKALDAVGVTYNAFIKHLLYDAIKHTPHKQTA